jgi:spermidine/putrescine-binding protein
MRDELPKRQITKKLNRRRVLAGSGALMAGLSGCLGSGSGDGGSGNGTTVGTAGGTEYADTLKILMWPYYDLDGINEPFKEEYGISIETAYFNGNSQAYNQLRTGGAEEFDIVMADSFWPQQYYQDDLIQPLDRERLTNLGNLFPAFHPDNLSLHVNDDGGYLGTPNAWGGYGISYNPDEVPESDAKSFMSSIYNEKYSGHISTSSRQTMNIANAGMALGHNDPKGSIWSTCEDSKLQEIADLLIEQKPYLITRYSDSRNLDRFYKQGDLWLFPEFSDAFRRLAFEGETIRHNLLTEEGGLGWLEAWMMTAGVKSEAKKNAVYAFLNWRLQKQWMKLMAEEVGAAPAVDLRDLWSDKENRIYFQDRTDVFSELTQFDIPKCPKNWQEYWTKVQSA